MEEISVLQVESLVIASIIAIIAIIGVDYVKNYYKKKILELGTGATVLRTVISTLKIVIVAIYALYVLTIFGVNISSLLAGLGLVSVIIGLALQDTLKDVFMGIHILLDHFFSVGDVVQYEGREYRVVSFNLSTTKLGDSADHSIYSICNRDVSKIKRIAQRYEFNAPFPYSLKSEEIHKILEEMKKKIMEIDVVEDARIMGLEEMGEYAKIYRLRVFCKPQVRCDIKRPINEIIVDTIEEKGYSIPFRTIDVNVKNQNVTAD